MYMYEQVSSVFEFLQCIKILNCDFIQIDYLFRVLAAWHRRCPRIRIRLVAVWNWLLYIP